MLRATKDFSLDQFEQLAAQQESAPQAVLQVPSNPPRYRGALGAEAALIQLIVTWARSDRAEALRTFIDSARLQESLDTFSAEAHGIVGLTLAPSIQDKDGSPISRNQALRAAAPRIEAMDNGGNDLVNTAKGTTVNLICVKGAKREYLFPLYSQRSAKGIRNRSEFSLLLRTLFRTVVPQRDWSAFGEGDAEALGEMCYELVKNTDDHATTDAKKNQYLKNARGLLTSYSVVDADYVKEVTKKKHALSKYFISRAAAVDGRSTVRLFELSVFDAGPGLARRQLGLEFSQISAEDELAATLKCFQLGATTKDSKSSGAGLYATWRMLRSLRGFIRIRTGRYSLYRTFNGDEADDDFEFWHWDPEKPVLSVTEGLLLTIVVPTRGGGK